MARTATDLREAEGLLRRAQGAPEAERLWLLTVTWQLLHEIAADLAAQQAAPPATITTAIRRSSHDKEWCRDRRNGAIAGEMAYPKVVGTRER
jgi:hypothetical protein